MPKEILSIDQYINEERQNQQTTSALSVLGSVAIGLGALYVGSKLGSKILASEEFGISKLLTRLEDKLPQTIRTLPTRIGNVYRGLNNLESSVTSQGFKANPIESTATYFSELGGIIKESFNKEVTEVDLLKKSILLD